MTNELKLDDLLVKREALPPIKRMMALNISSCEYENKNSMSFLLDEPVLFTVDYETNYLVNGKRIKNLCSNDMDLLDRLGIIYQAYTAPVYFRTNKVIIFEDNTIDAIFTGSKLIGVFEPRVHVVNCGRRDKKLELVLH